METVVMTMDEAIQKAVDECLVPLLRDRMEKDGAPWRTKEDAGFFRNYPPMTQYQAKSAWRKAEEIIGRPINERSPLWREILFYKELVESNEGRDDDEVVVAFESKFPNVPIKVVRSAVSVAEAKKHEPEDAAPKIPKIPGLEDAHVAILELEKLEKRKSILREKITHAEVEIKEVDRQIEAYAPMKRALDMLRSASEKVRQAAREGRTT